jgi:hypothetical protein
MGQYRGVLMMAAAVDPKDKIVPLAFALAEGENNDSWSWFMQLIWIHVLGTSRRVCIILDRHIGLRNAAREEIDGYPPLEHRWCKRHFGANFWHRPEEEVGC